VTVYNNLKPSRQCQLEYAKASEARGHILRTISFKSASVLLKLCISLVRVLCSAWWPYYEKDKFLLEGIQHRFTRMILGLKKLLYW